MTLAEQLLNVSKEKEKNQCLLFFRNGLKLYQRYVREIFHQEKNLICVICGSEIC